MVQLASCMHAGKEQTQTAQQCVKVQITLAAVYLYCKAHASGKGVTQRLRCALQAACCAIIMHSSHACCYLYPTQCLTWVWSCTAEMVFDSGTTIPAAEFWRRESKHVTHRLHSNELSWLIPLNLNDCLCTGSSFTAALSLPLLGGRTARASGPATATTGIAFLVLQHIL